MDKKPWKTEILVLWGVVIAAAVYFGWRGLDIIERVHAKHPKLGLFGWGLIFTWVMLGGAIGVIATNYCREKKFARACYVEGWAASALYFFTTIVLYLLIAGKP